MRIVSPSLPTVRPGTVAAVYRDSEWNDWIVYLVINGKKDEPSSYHTDSKADALAYLPTMAGVALERLPVTARD